MKRTLDLLISVALLVAMAPLLAMIWVVVRLTSPGPALHISRRIGRHGEPFAMPKFRTMRTDTPQLATHLLDDPHRWLTPVGRLLRRSSLDELPQLWCIAIGKMSLVGPRPALFNQHDLIAMRRSAGIDELSPGLTGWAQVCGRDELELAEKVARDTEYLQRRSLAFDFRILFLTAFRCLGSDGVVEGSRPTAKPPLRA